MSLALAALGLWPTSANAETGPEDSPNAPSAAAEPRATGITADPPPLEEPPDPIPQSPGDDPPLRQFELSAYGGAKKRQNDSERLDYRLGPILGFAGQVELAPWLSARANVRFEWIPVALHSGGYDWQAESYPNTRFEQGTLDVIALGVGLRPTWKVDRLLHLYLVLDLDWTRFTAPEPESHGAQTLRSAARSGVAVNYRAGLGARAEPLQDWLFVSLEGSGGLYGQQSGTAFEVLQGIDDDGQLVHLAPLPEFSSSVEVILGVGLIL